MHLKKLALLLLLYSIGSFSQNLSLREAVDKGTANYGFVKAKGSYARAAQETV
jgi:hypothetical protein